MTLRLLTKKEINSRKSDAQKQEIDEGVKLAKRVDGLRRTIADEELSLEKFRTKRVAEVHTEIQALEEKKGALEKVVEELERTRAQLLVPLDDKWEEVNKASERAQNALLEAENARSMVEAEELEIRKLRTKTEESHKYTVYCEEEADKNLKSATMELRKATELKEAAVRTNERAATLAAERQAELDVEHKKLEEQAKKLDEREQQIELGEKEIREEKIRLADQRATLERAFNRIKK